MVYCAVAGVPYHEHAASRPWLERYERHGAVAQGGVMRTPATHKARPSL